MPAKGHLDPIDPACTPAEHKVIQALRDMVAAAGPSATAVSVMVNVHKSSMSRYLRGETLPPWQCIEKVHQELKKADMEPWLTLRDLKLLHDDADSHRSERCAREAADLERARRTGTPVLADLLVGNDVADGAAGVGGTSLPVPPPRGDRRNFRPSTARPTPMPTTASADVQHQLVERAASVELSATALLSTLRMGADALDSRETAAALCLMQEEQRKALADDFLELVARYQPCPKVIETALVLLENGMNEEASTMMRTALKAHAGTN